MTEAALYITFCLKNLFPAWSGVWEGWNLCMNLPLKSTLIFTVECKTWLQLFLLCCYGAVMLCQCPGFLLTSVRRSWCSFPCLLLVLFAFCFFQINFCLWCSVPHWAETDQTQLTVAQHKVSLLIRRRYLPHLSSDLFSLLSSASWPENRGTDRPTAGQDPVLDKLCAAHHPRTEWGPWCSEFSEHPSAPALHFNTGASAGSLWQHSSFYVFHLGRIADRCLLEAHCWGVCAQPVGLGHWAELQPFLCGWAVSGPFPGREVAQVLSR